MHTSQGPRRSSRASVGVRRDWRKCGVTAVTSRLVRRFGVVVLFLALAAPAEAATRDSLSGGCYQVVGLAGAEQVRLQAWLLFQLIPMRELQALRGRAVPVRL